MSDHIIGSGDMLVPVAQIGYNGASNKANGAGVQPPRAALATTSETELRVMTADSLVYHTPVCLQPHSGEIGGAR